MYRKFNADWKLDYRSSEVSDNGPEERCPLLRVGGYFFVGFTFSVTVVFGWVMASFFGTNWPETALRTRVVMNHFLSREEIYRIGKW